MDNIPYDNYDHPYWEDDDESILEQLEPSDFYFYICEDPELAFGYDWVAHIIPKKFYDEKGYWYDQCLRVGQLFENLLPFKIGSDTETTYSAFDESITAEQARKAFKDIGMIENLEMWEID